MMFVVFGYFGFLLGQIAYVLVLSGLFCETWVRSFFQALLLAMITCFMMIGAVGLGRSVEPFSVMFMMPLLLPIFAVSGTIPMWIVRFFWWVENRIESKPSIPGGVRD